MTMLKAKLAEILEVDLGGRAPQEVKAQMSQCWKRGAHLDSEDMVEMYGGEIEKLGDDYGNPTWEAMCAAYGRWERISAEGLSLEDLRFNGFISPYKLGRLMMTNDPAFF